MEGATNDTPPEPPMTHRRNRLKIKCRRCNKFNKELPREQEIDVHEFGGKQDREEVRLHDGYLNLEGMLGGLTGFWLNILQYFFIS
ncbi:hypothetical protein P8452_54031 [Trifolium repens]|nr:hypothetical protein P8452_54031 [Trifolium repens]